MYMYWILVAITSFVLEIFTLTMLFLFIGIASIIMAGVLYIHPNLSIILQSILVSILGLLSFSLFYIFHKKRKKELQIDLNDRMSIHIGKIVNVAEATNQVGISKIYLGDTVWRAKLNKDVNKGDKVKIIAYDSTTFICEKIK